MDQLIAEARAQTAARKRFRALRYETHVLVLGWCLWLIGSWVAVLLVDSTQPAVRWMVFSALLGLMLLWPAVRLSQAAGRDDGARTWVVLRDWVALLLVFQAVVWPLRVNANWTLAQTALIDATIAGWSLLAGAVLAWGLGRGTAGRRSMAMAVCLLLLVGEPVAMTLLNLAATQGEGTLWHLWLSPVEAIWKITQNWRFTDAAPWITRAVLAWGLALIAWGALGVGRAIRSSRDATDPHAA